MYLDLFFNLSFQPPNDTKSSTAHHVLKSPCRLLLANLPRHRHTLHAERSFLHSRHSSHSSRNRSTHTCPLVFSSFQWYYSPGASSSTRPGSSGRDSIGPEQRRSTTRRSKVERANGVEIETLEIPVIPVSDRLLQDGLQE